MIDKQERETFMKYRESDIDSRILLGLDDMGFIEMTPIQELAIEPLIQGEDIIGQAQTGTGKTAAFGIPMIERMNPEKAYVQGLVLCPTRELAVQAAKEIEKMSKYVRGIKTLPVYGGADMGYQLKKLADRVHIVVGTPGRIMDHMRRGSLDISHVKMVVLDEADEMLNMGFREDIETILKEAPEQRQTALFSATMPEEIIEIAALYQKEARMLKVQQEELTIPLVKQSYYVVKGREKDTAMCRLLDFLWPKRALIFCNTKRKVDQLTLILKGKGYQADAIHGDLSQHQRERVMNLFRNGNLQLLLATDVAARGIDVDDVDMVFNYDMPQDMEYYVHRIGRTGRAGKKGKAVSLITPRERYKISSLEEYCNTTIKEKDMPTAESALKVKAYNRVSEAMEFSKEIDLNPYMKIVYRTCVEEGYDPLQVAGAFLRQSLGNVEIEAEETSDKRRSSNEEGSAKHRRSRSGDRKTKRGEKEAEKKSKRSNRKSSKSGERKSSLTEKKSKKSAEKKSKRIADKASKKSKKKKK